MPELRAVLLDAGGTLIHPDHEFILDRLAAEGVRADAGAYAEASRHAATAVGDLLRSDDPGTDAARARTFFGTLLTRLGLPADRMEAVGSDIRRRHEEGRLWVRTDPGTRAMLQGLLDAGLRLAVISNADGRVAAYLEAAGLRDLFEFVLDSALVGIEKPDPRIFELACARMGLRPEECVYVGDTFEVDVIGARKAGIDVVLLAEESRGDVPCIARLGELPTALGLASEPSRAGRGSRTDSRAGPGANPRRGD